MNLSLGDNFEQFSFKRAIKESYLYRTFNIWYNKIPCIFLLNVSNYIDIFAKSAELNEYVFNSTEYSAEFVFNSTEYSAEFVFNSTEYSAEFVFNSTEYSAEFVFNSTEYSAEFVFNSTEYSVSVCQCTQCTDRPSW